MRSGFRVSLARLAAKKFVAFATEQILSGQPAASLCIQGGCYATEPLEIVGESKKVVDVEKFCDWER